MSGKELKSRKITVGQRSNLYATYHGDRSHFETDFLNDVDPLKEYQMVFRAG